jgi:hypothetical protein
VCVSLSLSLFLSLSVHEGYSIQVIEEDELPACSEVTRMRGYRLVPHEEASVQTECGKEGPVVFTSDDWNRLR